MELITIKVPRYQQGVDLLEVRQLYMEKKMSIRDLATKYGKNYQHTKTLIMLSGATLRPRGTHRGSKKKYRGRLSKYSYRPPV